MARSLGRSLGAMLIVLGCTVDGGDDDTNPFGEGSAATSTTPTTTMGEATRADEGTTAGSGSATGTPTTSTPTSGEASSSGSPADSSDGPTPTDDGMGDSSGDPGSGGLGECIGTGAWTSCAQYCEAVLEVCVQAGCDGSTVVYYGDVGSCSAMEAGNGAATPCAEPFAGGGGISFARCCCQ